MSELSKLINNMREESIRDKELTLREEKLINTKGETGLTTEKLLAIYLLQKKELFPNWNPTGGEFQNQITNFVSVLLGFSFDQTKKGFERVTDIVKVKGVTKENKTKRLKQLNTVKTWFDNLGNTEISKEVETLISKTKDKVTTSV